MLSKIKKLFFTSVFFALYVSFAAQFVYVISLLFRGTSADTACIALGLLSVQWLIIIAARFLSKKSSSGANREGGNNFYNNRRR